MTHRSAQPGDFQCGDIIRNSDPTALKGTYMYNVITTKSGQMNAIYSDGYVIEAEKGDEYWCESYKNTPWELYSEAMSCE